MRAEDYQVTVFERERPPGEAVRLTRMEVKPAGVADVVHVYGDTAVPWLAWHPRFPRDAAVRRPGRRATDQPDRVADPAARAAGPSVAEMIRSDVLADDDCQIRAVEDYRLVFDSARKPRPAWW